MVRISESFGGRLITRDRGNCLSNCRFRWNSVLSSEREQYVSLVQISEEP